MNARPGIASDCVTFPARVTRSGGRWPRGLRLDEAAAYVGVSATKFDEWVKRAVMPRPKRQDGVVLWDRYRLDQSFDALPEEADKVQIDTWAHL